ncbi:MAG: MFS transporter [Mycobacterium sp.]
MVDARASTALWREVRSLPQFQRLLELRIASQFADGLFAAGLAVGLLFNPERAAGPWEVAGIFAVFYLPYSLLGPFAGALLDRWDRRQVLVVANVCRLAVVVMVAAFLAGGAPDIPVLVGALLVNAFTRFVASGMSAALPDVVPQDRVVTMNSVATATGATATFVGANLMLVPRSVVGQGDAGAATVIGVVIVPVVVALVLSWRFAPHVLGPDESVRAVHGSVAYAVSTGWLHGIRTIYHRPAVAATLVGLAAHRMTLGINTLLVLVLVRHYDTEIVSVAGLGTAGLFVAATGVGQFVATVFTPAAIRKWGRYATVNGALLAAAVLQIAATTLQVPVMLVGGLLLGSAGQLIKLCADSAIQLDVDDALRGHVFTVQDSIFWVAFIAAMTMAAAVIPPNGMSRGLALAGVGVYLAGLCLHTLIVRRGKLPADR